MADSPPIAVITGTTHGIGTVTSMQLARTGYDVVMLCRNVAAAHDVARKIRLATTASHVAVVHCDLADLSSVRAAAREVLSRFPRIDRLINNAGIVSIRQRRSVDGHELTFATNHLGPFLLTRLLLPAMAPASRILYVASKVHYRGRLDLDTVDDPAARYSALAAYARSKLANVMDTFILARQLADTDIRVNSLHPGMVATNLLPGWLNLLRPLYRRYIISAEQGARTTLYLALDEQAGRIHGQYLDEHQQVQRAAAEARDRTLQDELWLRSARWTGLDQPRP